MTTSLTSYVIRVDGHLDDHWAEWLDDRDLTRNGDGTSTLTVPIADQTQLHGVLAALRDIGATLIDVHATAPAAGQKRAADRPVLERPLATERLTLRAATAADADLTWTFRRLAAVNEWLPGSPADLDGHREMFTESARLATTGIVLLGHDAESPVIGDVMLRRHDAWAQRELTDLAKGSEAELGWVLDPTHGGYGYATEAVRELLRYCFDDLAVRRVTATCFLDNDPSWRLMERVGMRRETHAVRESLHRSGQWLDTVGYALLADEWRA